MACIGKPLSRVDFAVLKRHGKRVTVQDSLDDDFIQLRFYRAPVFVVFLQHDFVIRNGDSHIRACTHNDTVLFTGLHVDDAAVRVRKVIQKRGSLFLALYSYRLSLCGDGFDFQVSRRTVMIFYKCLKACLDSLACDLLAVGKCNIVLQIDFYRIVVNLLIVLCQPWLKLQVILEAEQRLADAVAYGRPAHIGIMRICSRVFVGRAVRCRAVGEYLFLGCLLLLSSAAARQKNRSAQCQCRENRRFFRIHHDFLSFIYVFEQDTHIISDQTHHEACRQAY